MPTSTRDLWPDDIQTADVVTPEEFLREQAEILEAKTNGLLVGRLMHTDLEDRVLIGFEVEAPRIKARTRLFEVVHRVEFEYPVAIVVPDQTLPSYLTGKVYRPSAGDLLRGSVSAGQVFSEMMAKKGEWTENEWVATSPVAFKEKLHKALNLPLVKAAVLSLISRANRNKTNGDDRSTDDSAS